MNIAQHIHMKWFKTDRKIPIHRKPNYPFLLQLSTNFDIVMSEPM